MPDGRLAYSGVMRPDHKWASQVLGLIKKYQLYSFDENPDNQTQLAQNEQVKRFFSKT